MPVYERRAGSEKNRPAFDLAKVQKVVEQEKGELSLGQRLRCKIRHLSDGVIWEANPLWKLIPAAEAKFGYKRKSVPITLDILGPAGLWVFRKLRVRTFG